jgi:hypothetical protein
MTVFADEDVLHFFGAQVAYVTVPQPMSVFPDGEVIHDWMYRRLCSLMER